VVIFFDLKENSDEMKLNVEQLGAEVDDFFSVDRVTLLVSNKKPPPIAAATAMVRPSSTSRGSATAKSHGDKSTGTEDSESMNSGRNNKGGTESSSKQTPSHKGSAAMRPKANPDPFFVICWLTSLWVPWQGKRGAIRALVNRAHQQADSGTLVREAMAHNIKICSKTGDRPPVSLSLVYPLDSARPDPSLVRRFGSAMQNLLKKHLGPTSKSLRQSQAASDKKLLASMRSRAPLEPLRKKLIIQNRRDLSTIAAKEFKEGKSPLELVGSRGTEANPDPTGNQGYFGDPDPSDTATDEEGRNETSKRETSKKRDSGAVEKTNQPMKQKNIYCETCRKRVRDYDMVQSPNKALSLRHTNSRHTPVLCELTEPVSLTHSIPVQHIQEAAHTDFWEDPCNYSTLLDFLIGVVDKTTLAWQSKRRKLAEPPPLVGCPA